MASRAIAVIALLLSILSPLARAQDDKLAGILAPGEDWQVVASDRQLKNCGNRSLNAIVRFEALERAFVALQGLCLARLRRYYFDFVAGGLATMPTLALRLQCCHNSWHLLSGRETKT